MAMQRWFFGGAVVLALAAEYVFTSRELEQTVRFVASGGLLLAAVICVVAGAALYRQGQ